MNRHNQSEPGHRVNERNGLFAHRNDHGPEIAQLCDEAERVLSLVTIPRTTSDCAPGGPGHLRPCPWAQCRYHLLMQSEDEAGRVTLAEPERAAHRPAALRTVFGQEAGIVEALVDRLADMPHTCALDVARDLEGREAAQEQVSEALLLGLQTVAQLGAAGLRELAGDLEMEPCK